MRKNCASSSGNIFMDHFVSKYINPSLLKVLSLVSLRFIDGIFFIKTRSEIHLAKLLKWINNQTRFHQIWMPNFEIENFTPIKIILYKKRNTKIYRVTLAKI